MSNEKITSENLEELFDEGCDVTGFFDFDSALEPAGCGMRGGSAALAFPIRRCASRRALRAL